jgi:hypothetical protein
MCCKPEPGFIRKSFPKDKVYSVYLSQINIMEKTIIALGEKDQNLAYEASMDIGFKLFPIIESISLNILGKRNGREYLKTLDYSGRESDMIYSMFRNGITHSLNPYEFKFENGVVSWGLMSSGGSSGFTPHFPGYKDKNNPDLNMPADKAFTLEKLSDGGFHASLSLDRLVAQIRFDLNERLKTDKRGKIDVVIGQRLSGKVPFSG